MIKIKFIKSPVGAFGLAYAENTTHEIEEVLAKELIESGYALLVDEPKEVDEPKKKGK